MFESLRDRDFRYLWIGTVTAGFGQWGQQIGLFWLVFVLTDSAVQLGFVSFVGGILSLFFGPFAGLISDRYPRRTVIIVSNVLGAAQAAILTVLILVDLVQVWHAYVFAIATTLTQTVNQPARQAYVNDLSTPETLTNGIALNSLAQNASRIIGPPFVGVLVAWNIGAAFVFVTVTRVIATITAMAMRRLAQEPLKSHRNPFIEVGDGFAYLGKDRQLLLLLMLTALPSLFIVPYLTFMPIFASEVYGGGAREYGLLAAMIGVGSFVGLLFIAWVGDLKAKSRYMLFGELMYCILVLVFTRMEVLIAGLAMLATAGVFHGVGRTLAQSIFQANVRSDMRGRAMAAFQTGSALMPIGALSMGFLVDHFGVQNGVALSQMCALTGVVLIILFGRSIRTS